MIVVKLRSSRYVNESRPVFLILAIRGICGQVRLHTYIHAAMLLSFFPPAEMAILQELGTQITSLQTPVYIGESSQLSTK